MSKDILGLKKLRKNSKDRVPSYTCENCKCKRYSPCGCERKAPEEVSDVPTEETNG